MRIIVVGASAAGVSAAEALRREGFRGRLTLVGAERHLPYDRPPLSKQFLSGAWPAERTALRPAGRYQELDAELLLGRRAVGLDPVARRVRLDSGERLDYDQALLATGVLPRPLPSVPHPLAGVHVLRTLDDAVALRATLAGRPRLAVVGGGFTGTEVAATARGLGLDVTLVCPEPAPLAARLGPEAGALVGRLHVERGVALRTAVAVGGLTSAQGRVTGIRLDDGSVVAAEAVVVAVGSTPATSWLADSGLELADGIVCDPTLRAAPGVFAAGDVARVRHPVHGPLVRQEHRTNAALQGVAAARNLLGAGQAFHAVPYVWTDQYDVRIQLHGTCPPDAELEVLEGRPGDGAFVARCTRGGVTTGLLGWNSQRQLAGYRRELVGIA
ncbi:FAD-dependent oxidoreductase [Streptomyces sp. TRM66268-LWL]|uniref:FAD-dependent oxidoreductase n=1 Tax=Streptomyces polyasparticus TaxID=2767826 RepID=A0ABR7SPG5_9ACTN|nr:FAD-dependent oxidoreductase [Streptomyces polyasparticus]MBC9716487.1 FAD-dependent oxidoreductase [Streptomyces polyasparticus]